MSTYVLVQQALVEEFCVSPVDIRPGAALTALGLGPDDAAELLATMATRFDVSLPEDAVDGLRTIEDAVQVVHGLRTSPRRPATSRDRPAGDWSPSRIQVQRPLRGE